MSYKNKDRLNRTNRINDRLKNIEIILNTIYKVLNIIKI